MFVDLHLHTTRSDGRWSPRRVVEEAAARELVAVAITDHDVVSGLPEARRAAARVGIELVDGVELTAEWDGRVCHVLGYGIDPEAEVLRAALDRGRARIEAHVRGLLAELRAAGHELSETDLARCRTKYPTATAVVLGMLERGILRDRPTALRLLDLARQEPRAYSAAEAIDVIHRAGGLAVLAHPARLRKGEPLLSAEMFQPLVDQGLDGIEAWQIVQGEAARQHYRFVAESLGLLATGGSDCHGPRSSGPRIGSQRVPYEVLVALRERSARGTR